jgi:hypothetical protein
MHKHQLTRHARELLNILRERGDWMSHHDLMVALSRGRMHSHSIRLLKAMVDQGLLEVRCVEISLMKTRCEYRVKQS